MNFSDRFLGIVAGTKPPGNDPHTVIEAFRHYGGIPEEMLPFTDYLQSVDQYYSYIAEDKATCLVEGQKFLTKYQIGHEWIVTQNTPTEQKLNLLKQGLFYSPIGISVDAWYQNAEGLYYSPPGSINAHWTMCYKIDETGIYVFDSYQTNGTFLKKLTLNHNIQFAKRYSLTPLDPTVKKNWLIDLIKSLWNTVFQLEKLKATVESLKDTPKDPYQEVKDSLKDTEHVRDNPYVKRNMIKEWATAIIPEEGGKPGDRNIRNNNPGNLKFSPLTKRLGATSSDKDNFCIFPTPTDGFNALCEFLTLACKDQLLPYHKARTLKQFTKTYALPPNDIYASNIAKKLGVSIDTDISTFL